MLVMGGNVLYIEREILFVFSGGSRISQTGECQPIISSNSSQKLHERDRDDVVTFEICVLACKMTSLINKLADWPPNYHETATAFPQIFCTPHSLNKPTLHKPAKNGSRGGDVCLWYPPFGSAIDLNSVLITTDRMAAPMHQST